MSAYSCGMNGSSDWIPRDSLPASVLQLPIILWKPASSGLAVGPHAHLTPSLPRSNIAKLGEISCIAGAGRTDSLATSRACP